ncbi:MAG: hypothetical protein IH630_06800 [Thermoplasmata archaeon]|nr:hypothetical protein [Thermoplasmata archaeon]
MGKSGDIKSGKPSRKDEKKAVLFLDLKVGKADRCRDAVTPEQAGVRELVTTAAKEGRLSDVQFDALSDLCSRMSLLGFDTRRSLSTLVSNIATEEDPLRRRQLAFELHGHLMSDGLTKDMIRPFSTAFELP